MVLYDNTANLLPVLTSNGRHDFIVEHDLKEIGPHTYVYAPYARPPHLRPRCAERSLGCCAIESLLSRGVLHTQAGVLHRIHGHRRGAQVPAAGKA